MTGESSISARRDRDSDTASSPIRHAPLRIGILGAARIAEQAIVDPARATGDRLVAVAARDPERTKAFADTHGVERALGSYAELIADPEVDIVYNPLANGLRGPWNRAAVLRASTCSRRSCSRPTPSRPARCATSRWPRVSPSSRASTTPTHGRAGLADHLSRARLGRGGAGTQRRPAATRHRLTVWSGGDVRVERLGTRSTYTYQLEALGAHLRDEMPFPLDVDDAVATAELIDAAYTAAGLPPRPRTVI